VAQLIARTQRPISISPLSPANGHENQDAVIRIHQLEHFYLRGLPLQARALDHVDFDVANGSSMGLIGPTGSGKSTLMQHLNGLLRPQSGTVKVGPHDLGDPNADLRTVRRMVGLVFQQPEDQLFEQYVGDDIAFGPRQYGLSREQVRERVRWAMDLVGLGFDEFKDRMTGALSGGERRRAALAGVFALHPQILVADEPTAGLDPHARSEVLGILQHLHSEGTTLVIASHRMDDIATLCDHVTALDSGRVFSVGTLRETYSQPTLLQSHGLDVPPVAQVAQALRDQGWQIPSGVLFANELVAALGGA
jgi:energy-coupling factor transporter ATPase